MWKKRHIREIILLSIFLIAAFGIGISSTLLNRNQSRNTTSAQASTNWDDLCKNGVYYIPKNGEEISCGRAPNCDGYSYESMAGIAWRSNAECWVEDYYGGDHCKAYCAGNVPLCCYKMAETGNAEDCPFPERGYCMRDQCKPVQDQDPNCGAQQSAWCIDRKHCIEHRSQIPKLSLADRLAGRSAPQNSPTTEPTATPRPPEPTVTPTTRPNNSPTTALPSPTTSVATPTTSTNPTTPTISTTSTAPTTSTQAATPTTGSQAVVSSPTPVDHAVLPTQFSLPQNPANTPSANNAVSGQPAATQKPVADIRMPEIEIKSPKQLLREAVDRPAIEKLNRTTEVPLTAARNVFITVKSYDQKLENTVEGWIFYIKVQINKLLR